MESIITVENVSKYFKETVALRQVTVSFEQGKIHGLIGRNGSGKTVLLKCLCGLMHPDEGKITVNGQIIDERHDIPESLGAIIEAPGFLPNYSGYRNLQFLAGINHRICREQIQQAMITVGLDPQSRKHVGKYSLGMRQRLGLAQAIMEDPALLILDEPTKGIDVGAKAEFYRIITECAQQGMAVIVISSELPEVIGLSDRILVMREGRITGELHRGEFTEERVLKYAMSDRSDAVRDRQEA